MKYQCFWLLCVRRFVEIHLVWQCGIFLLLYNQDGVASLTYRRLVDLYQCQHLQPTQQQNMAYTAWQRYVKVEMLLRSAIGRSGGRDRMIELWAPNNTHPSLSCKQTVGKICWRVSQPSTSIPPSFRGHSIFDNGDICRTNPESTSDVTFPSFLLSTPSRSAETGSEDWAVTASQNRCSRFRGVISGRSTSVRRPSVFVTGFYASILYMQRNKSVNYNYIIFPICITETKLNACCSWSVLVLVLEGLAVCGLFPYPCPWGSGPCPCPGPGRGGLSSCQHHWTILWHEYPAFRTLICIYY